MFGLKVPCQTDIKYWFNKDFEKLNKKESSGGTFNCGSIENEFSFSPFISYI